MTLPGTFEDDIAGQPAALRALTAPSVVDALPDLEVFSYDRVILTGMGASHYSSLPSWRSLVQRGVPAWWLSTSELLDCPELVTVQSLVFITSQSGRSGEIVSLIQSLVQRRRPRCIIGVTNDLASPLADASDVVVDLRCGDEATVSTKSYLNSLAVHRLLLTSMYGDEKEWARKTVADAADELEAWSMPENRVKDAVGLGLELTFPRLALIGSANQAASALVGALVVKEAAKVPAEGFIGGAFRHGPVELAGPGLTAVLFMGTGQNPSLAKLGSDLRATGANTVELGRKAPDEGVVTPSSSELSQMMLETKFTQLMSVALAHAQGITPGAFRFGQKVTSAL